MTWYKSGKKVLKCAVAIWTVKCQQKGTKSGPCSWPSFNFKSGIKSSDALKTEKVETKTETQRGHNQKIKRLRTVLFLSSF